MPPAKLFFYYEQPAKVGGLNPVLSVRDLVGRLPLDMVEELERRHIRYENFYPACEAHIIISCSSACFVRGRCCGGCCGGAGSGGRGN